jgi:hypothetical protein
MYLNCRNLKIILLSIFLFAGNQFCTAQDSAVVSAPVAMKKEKKEDTIAKDTTVKKINRPRIAAIRSAIFPGLGQIYNKKYWKLPIVYGALGATAFVFNYNLKNYKDLKQAYIGKYNARVFKDSVEYFKIKSKLLPLSEESVRFNRDEFRKNVDYSVLFFLILWGVNVIDATVDAHLKSFDITPDLSFKIIPGHSELANTNGISIVMKIGK